MNYLWDLQRVQSQAVGYGFLKELLCLCHLTLVGEFFRPKAPFFFLFFFPMLLCLHATLSANSAGVLTSSQHKARIQIQQQGDRSSTQTLSLPSKFAVAHPQRALGEKCSGRKGHTKMHILWDCPVKSAWLMRPHMREMSREGEEANRALTIILELLQTKRPQGAKAESQNEIDRAASRKSTTALEGWLQDDHHCQCCFANGAL